MHFLRIFDYKYNIEIIFPFFGDELLASCDLRGCAWIGAIIPTAQLSSKLPHSPLWAKLSGSQAKPSSGNTSIWTFSPQQLMRLGWNLAGSYLHVFWVLCSHQKISIFISGLCLSTTVAFQECISIIELGIVKEASHGCSGMAFQCRRCQLVRKEDWRSAWANEVSSIIHKVASSGLPSGSSKMEKHGARKWSSEDQNCHTVISILD